MPVGRLPTSWWPSGAVVDADGSITVINMRGHPIGPFPVMDGGDGETFMKGSIEQIPAPTAADLTAGEAQVAATVAVGRAGRLPDRSPAPGGVSDFPVPPSTTPTARRLDQAHLLHRAREQDLRLALRRHARRGRRRRGHDEGDDRRDGPGLAQRPRARPHVHRRATTTTALAVQVDAGPPLDHVRPRHRLLRAHLERQPPPRPALRHRGRGPPAEEGSLFEWLQRNSLVYYILGEIVGHAADRAERVQPHRHQATRAARCRTSPTTTWRRPATRPARLRVACDLGTSRT